MKQHQPFTVILTQISHRFINRFFALSVVSTVLFVHAISAQTTTADLSGTVADENGALLPNVTLRAINVATNLERQAMTGEDGAFTLPLLPPGGYTLRAERAGFAPIEINDVVLNVNDRRTIRISLRVGAVGAAVTVEDAPALVDESPTVGTTIDRQFVENLPLNGRSFQSLIALTPGVTFSPSTAGRQGQFNANGQREGTNYFTVDGVSANVSIAGSVNTYGGGGQYPAFNALGTTSSLVSLDALQEFKIQTSTFAPEFGRTPGAQVTTVTRSGANRFSGTAFEYLRNDALDANDFFANRAGLRRPPLRSNQFGGTFSGPVILPFGEGENIFDGRDSTFFFFSYEGLRLIQPLTSTREVPSLSARAQASGIISRIFNAFPRPNGRDFGNGVAEFIGGYSDPSKLDAASIRLDHKFGDKVTLFGRYNYAPSQIQVRGVSNNSLSAVSQTKQVTQTFTAGSTGLFGANLINDFRFNYTKYTNRFSGNRLDDFGGAIPIDESLVIPAGQTGDTFIALQNTNSPVLRIGGLGRNRNEQFNVVNTFSVVRGAHQIKFGFDYRRLMPVLGQRAYSQLIDFPNVAAAIAGRASRVRVNAVPAPVALAYDNFSFFAQDVWRVNNRLTLTYGLRYEIVPEPREKNGRYAASVQGIENLATAALAPLDTPLYETKFDNFAPRVGVAYQLFNRPGRETVVRGGFGVFYDTASTQLAAAYDSFFFPFGTLRTLLPETGATFVPFPVTPAQAAPRAVDSISPPYDIGVFYDRDLNLPYTLQFNVAVEQSLGKNQTLTATYVGALGRRLYSVTGYRRPNPNFRDIDVIGNLSSSDYHAAQFQFQRRLSLGLQALASYTFAKSIDTASFDFSTGSAALPPSIAPFEQNRGPSTFDIRHQFNLALTYNLPSPFKSGFGRAVFGGFAVDSIFRQNSAPPVTINVSTAVREGSINSFEIRPDLTGQPLYIDDPNAPGGRRINRAAFATVPIASGQLFPSRQGTLGRNVLRGFGFSQLDFALRRQINFTETFNVQLKAEVFNILNRANFALPPGVLAQNITATSGLFGQPNQSLNRGLGGVNALYQSGGPRSIQLSLKLRF